VTKFIFITKILSQKLIFLVVRMSVFMKQRSQINICSKQPIKIQNSKLKWYECVQPVKIAS